MPWSYLILLTVVVSAALLVGFLLFPPVMTAVLVLAAVLTVAVLRNKRLIEQSLQLADRMKGLGKGKISTGSLSSEDKDELAPVETAFDALAKALGEELSDLKQDKAQLSSILANMVEAVVAVDNTGRILVVNPKLVSLFGIEEQQVRGKMILEVIRHNQLNDLVHRVLQDKKPISGEVKIFSPHEMVFETQAVPLFKEFEFEGVLLVLHDITRIRALEQLRREFVANVSHELRTPLSAIRGFAETLRMGAMDDKKNRDDFVRSIESHAEQMTTLVDELLNLAAIESGQQPVEKKPVNLSDIIEGVVDNLKPLAAKKKIQWKCKFENKDAWILGDMIQLKQVFVNMLENAMKFNKQGGSIEVSTIKNNNILTVAIHDTGVGIPEKDLPRIFERFFRVDKARSREMGGTGLGLSIVKHIVENHQGELSVESQEGSGSTFYLRFPILQNIPN